MINYFAISGLCVGFINLGLAILISFSARTNLHRVWSFVNYSISLWGFGMFISGSTTDYEIAFIGWRIFNVGIILISVLYYHVVYLFCKLESRKFLIYSYAQGLIFIVLAVFTDLLFTQIFSFGQFYYFRASIFHHFLMLNFSIVVSRSFYELYRYIRRSSGISNIQAKYLTLAMFFGFGGGLNTAPAAWGFPVYPYGQIFACLYGAVATYAIFKYQLLDVRIAVSRFGIFVFVYSLVLGIPIWAGYKMFGMGSWLIPVCMMAVFATLGPFVYMFLQRRAEDKLLQESRAIQDLLTSFSIGLRTVRELAKLIKLIVRELGKSLQLDFAGIYLLDPNHGDYVLKMSEPALSGHEIIKADHPLLHFLHNKNKPLMLDELKHQFENEKENNPIALKATIDLFQNLHGKLIIPAITENLILAFVVLGEPKVKIAYSREFLGVMTVVGNQIALAIENALYYEETGKDWVQRSHDSRQKTMGAMGTGVAHQIRNRFNVVSTQGLYLQDLFDGFDFKKATEEDFEKLKEKYNKIIERMFADIEQGVEICENIKNYAKNTEGKPQLVELEKTITGAMRLLNLAKKSINFTLSKENTEGIFLWTNLSMLQDMFLNMFDNSDDAIVTKKKAIEKGELEKNNDDFKVNISARANGKMCEIVVEDNGDGIKPEHLEEDKGVHVMWFTTKGAQKGTGMGIHFMREFVKHNGGTLKIDSEYTKWTRITFTLPLATDEQKKQEEADE